MEINSVVIIFLVWFFGAIVGRIIFKIIEHFRNPRAKVNKLMKKWVKNIEKMTNEEVDQLLKDHYDWKERAEDDLEECGKLGMMQHQSDDSRVKNLYNWV